MYVVTGATGNTGSVVAESLLDAGAAVRIVVRDPAHRRAKELAARGAEVAVATFEDGPALERALRGADGVYLLSHPDVRATSFLAERRRLLDGVARAVEDAAVPHVVFLSSVGAQHETGTGPIRSLHAGEAALARTGAATTFVRAAYFVENWGAVASVAKSDGVLPTFLAHAKAIPMVAAQDIGVVAARALREGPRGRRVLELDGPALVSPDDVASAFGRALGRTVTAQDAPLDAVVPTFTSLGISADDAALYREMYEGIASGKVDYEGRGAERVHGTTAIDASVRALVG